MRPDILRIPLALRRLMGDRGSPQDTADQEGFTALHECVRNRLSVALPLPLWWRKALPIRLLLLPFVSKTLPFCSTAFLVERDTAFPLRLR